LPISEKHDTEAHISTRSRTTFTKRQKEHTRQQKQKDKLERRDQRKTEKREPGSGPEIGTNDMLMGFDEDLPGDATAKGDA
jgi:hypothetical protein